MFASLRVDGLLSNTHDAFEKKHLLIFPNNYPFTKLLARYYHCKPFTLVHNTCWPENLQSKFSQKYRTQRLRKFIKQNQGDLEAAFSKENIEWKCIPPRSPHFGGLWEVVQRE
nr:unnamed protein product [Callosobruchus chinensis]